VAHEAAEATFQISNDSMFSNAISHHINGIIE
jgi:hypothetical protein